jgi:transcriptional regulator with XRE-family HTH domain
MTQFTLALRTRISVSKISFIENGYRQATLADQLKLARALGVEITEAFPVPADQLESVAS